MPRVSSGIKCGSNSTKANEAKQMIAQRVVFPKRKSPKFDHANNKISLSLSYYDWKQNLDLPLCH